MLTIYSDDHHLHHGKYELIDGQLTPCFEKPSRAPEVKLKLWSHRRDQRRSMDALPLERRTG